MKNMFAVNLKLQGWNEDVVMEVIHKYFNHSPNNVGLTKSPIHVIPATIRLSSTLACPPRATAAASAPMHDHNTVKGTPCTRIANN